MNVRLATSFERHRGQLKGLGRQAAFTMIEIAIALGVIGFALVAIIGILPAGLQVQRDNRAETIINQDGTYWLEAIRGGGFGADELTNFVERVIVLIRDPITPSTIVSSNRYSFGGVDGDFSFANGRELVGILGTQAANTNADVSAYVWAISGSAAEKELEASAREISFKYRMRVQIDPAIHASYSFDQTTSSPEPSPLVSLYDVRLSMSYPVVREDRPAPRRQVYRTMASRNLITITTNSPGVATTMCWFVE